MNYSLKTWKTVFPSNYQVPIMKTSRDRGEVQQLNNILLMKKSIMMMCGD